MAGYQYSYGDPIYPDPVKANADIKAKAYRTGYLNDNPASAWESLFATVAKPGSAFATWLEGQKSRNLAAWDVAQAGDKTLKPLDFFAGLNQQDIFDQLPSQLRGIKAGGLTSPFARYKGMFGGF